MTRYDTWLTTQPEYPETCPQCGRDNSTDDGEWLVPEAIPFCSAACQARFDEAEAEAERKALTCPKCNKHLDDHTLVTVADENYGEYETYQCPAVPVDSSTIDFAAWEAAEVNQAQDFADPSTKGAT